MQYYTHWHRVVGLEARPLNKPDFFCSLPAALRAAQTCRYFVYSEADFEVFRPAGATRCTDGGEIWHGGGDGPLSSMPNFTPIGETTRV